MNVVLDHLYITLKREKCSKRSEGAIANLALCGYATAICSRTGNFCLFQGDKAPWHSRYIK